MIAVRRVGRVEAGLRNRMSVKGNADAGAFGLAGSVPVLPGLFDGWTGSRRKSIICSMFLFE